MLESSLIFTFSEISEAAAKRDLQKCVFIAWFLLLLLSHLLSHRAVLKDFTSKYPFFKFVFSIFSLQGNTWDTTISAYI